MTKSRWFARPTPVRSGASWAWTAVVGGAVVHVAAASALAQQPARLPEGGSGVLQWVIAAGIGVIVCITAFLNPKRSHLT